MSTYSLSQLGWSALFAQHLTLEDLTAAHPARIASVHRTGLDALSERGLERVVLPSNLIEDGHLPVSVGDWVLVENEAPRLIRVLERRSLVARMAAGTEQRLQLIAANLDTLFVVTSCNQDCNLSRLERYLAVAHEARVEPVMVMTKIDLCENSETFVAEAREVAAQVIALDATSSQVTQVLQPWLDAGQTLAFVGSSGVGKSTLVNTLLGDTRRPRREFEKTTVADATRRRHVRCSRCRVARGSSTRPACAS